MIKYGLISKVDAETLEKTIDLIFAEFPYAPEICVTEIGIYNGQTSRGVKDYIESKGKPVNYTAIDNNHDFPVDCPFPGCDLIIGNSNEVYNQLLNYSQHLIIVDGLHTFPGVISDFFCYASKVHVDGFMMFHDSGPHIHPFKDWQRVGQNSDPDMCISVRKALAAIGLLHNKFRGWVDIFDTYDPNDEAGGFFVIKKIG